MTELKLNHRLPQTADRLSAYETGVENELRRRTQLMGGAGIVSATGLDVDTDDAACSVIVNASVDTSIDVLAGTVVFGNGEFVDVTSTSIVNYPINTLVTDGQVVRLEYGEVEDGDLEANPFSNFAAPPKTRKKTPREMVVVETVTAYNAQSADVKNRSVVLGVVRYSNSELTIDNGRDTYSWSRPWSSPIDVEHRSQVGSGAVTAKNPHGTSGNDLSVGSYSMAQALGGPPACVIARPRSVGRYPGELCFETIPSGSFLTDTTGNITGKANAFYATLGDWPDRLLMAYGATVTDEVAAWIPHGRNIIAVYDPNEFAAPVNLNVYYTKVTAGALPGGALVGLTSVELQQPHEDELLVAGGNFITTLAENTVHFSDVGLVPTRFDICVDGTGRAYKRPEVVYCNAKLDTIGSSPVPFTIQPRSPSRLRVAVSNFVGGFTEIKFQITGTNEAGATISELVTQTGAGAVVPAYSENVGIFRWTQAVFATLTQLQVITRDGDGPNTTVTVFAEHSPARPATQDDLIAATVHWTGVEVNGLYANNRLAALDRRLVTPGGFHKGLSPMGSLMDQPAIVDTVLGSAPAGSTVWATIVEDFSNPMYWTYQEQHEAEVSSETLAGEPRAGGIGFRGHYASRKIPFAEGISLASLASLYFRLIPKAMNSFPNKPNVTVVLNLHIDGSTYHQVSGSITTTYPPFQVPMTGTMTGGVTYFAVSIGVSMDDAELFQGFLLHIRS